MSFNRGAAVAVVGLFVLAGCGGGAGTVNLTPQRQISSDISASMGRGGPTAAKPGMLGTQEPVGAFPWEIGGNRD
jgi:hypothetical protein